MKYFKGPAFFKSGNHATGIQSQRNVTNDEQGVYVITSETKGRLLFSEGEPGSLGFSEMSSGPSREVRNFSHPGPIPYESSHTNPLIRMGMLVGKQVTPAKGPMEKSLKTIVGMVFLFAYIPQI